MSDSDDSSQWSDEDDEDEEEDDEWKNSIRKRMEDELARRVANALPETPPLERLRKRQEAARRAQEESDIEDLNAHLDFSEEFYQKREQEEAISNIKGRLMGLNDLWNRPKQAEPNEEEPETSEEMERREIYRQYQFFEPNSRPPPHLLNYGGLTNTSITSFDANSLIPLLPHPVHLHIIPTDPEPLYTPIKFVIGSRTYENQVTKFTHKLRGSGIVYDSQKSPKVQKVEAPSNPLIAPNLVFESRFESGNLRQARRVGQFEYELVLKTDMFTKRHTQWYYFRMQNMVPGIIYKFRIANLLKKDSLYNYGMRPLIYSERTASEKRQGWIRHGHHISYSRNVQHLLSPLLNREMPYYELEWQMEFPYINDTCYIAHCYPFSHTDLKRDLAAIQANDIFKSFIKQEVMCETRAGHECHLLTITNFEKTHCNKRCVVVSARVHPGESNASWMMKGLYEFLISDQQEAKELRDRFVFKIVPMLNPDGVIVGNYRCSLQARDLNRNYRWPRKERFPTIWHVKKLVETVQQETGVFAYCDFHGHSRKSNVFMYGNSTADVNEDKSNAVKDFLSERMLPYMISELDPEMFNFQSSRFAIRKCKESTGRVVMFRQHNIVNSFTMEATFSGTKIDQDGARHYNQQDFMDAGALFARGVLQYSKVIEDKQKESEAFLSLAKSITQQVLNNSIKQKLASTTRSSNIAQESAEQPGHNENSTLKSANKSAERTEAATAEKTDQNTQGDSTHARGSIEGDDSNDGISISGAKAAMEQLKQITSNTEDSVQECFNLLQNLSLANNSIGHSDSSDSDSESEPEMKDEKKKKNKNKKKKNKKKDGKKQVKNLSNISPEYVLRNFKPAASRVTTKVDGTSQSIPITNGSSDRNAGQSSASSRLGPQPVDSPITRLRVLPAIGDEEGIKAGPSSSRLPDIKLKSSLTVDPFLEGPVKMPQSWSNPYVNRSNGGIPCFSEERSLERAAKKMAELQKKVEERAKRQQHYIPYSHSSEYTPEFDLDLQELNALKLQKKHVQDSFNKSIRTLTQSCVPDVGVYTGRLEGSIPGYDSEFIDSGNSLYRKKKKSLTPINDSYAPTEYNTPRDKWQWYPKESTHGREKSNAYFSSALRNSEDHVSRTNQTSGTQRLKHSVLLGTSVSQKQQPNSRSLFPSARLGPVPRAPQAGRLKNVLKVNPLHHQHGYE